MTKEELFICTLDDIETRLQSQDHYEILMTAGLLRKLLLDGQPLVDAANRTYKLKISFVVNDRQGPSIPGVPMPSFWSIEDGFDPDTSVPHLSKPLVVKKDQLLVRPLMYFDGHVITVRDLILHISNIQGAVHSGEPKDKKDKALAEISRTLFIGGLPAGIRLLRAVSRVILKGIQPLRQAVLEGTKP